MGKGNRNRLDRADAANGQNGQKKTSAKVKKARKPMSKALKVTIACVLVVLIVGGIVAGALWNNGVFRSRTPLVKSTTGDYNLTKAGATYLLWESQINYMMTLYTQYGIINSSANQGTIRNYYATFISNARSNFATEEAVVKALNESKDALTGYVAVCDIADTLDVTLTRAEIKEARASALSMLNAFVSIAEESALSKLNAGTAKDGNNEVPYTQKDYRKDSCSSANEFLKKYVSPGITKEDVMDAAVIATLYNKALSEKNSRIEASLIENGVMNAEELEKYRDKNKSTFFSTDYLKYETEDADLIAQLKKIADETKDEDEKIKAIKTLIATTVAEKSYPALFNRYAAAANADATALYNKMKENNKFGKDDLTGYGLDYHEKDTDDQITPDKVKSWITDSSRKANDCEIIAVNEDGIYVVVFLSKDTKTVSEGEGENKKEKTVDCYTYAIKKFDLKEAPESYSGDENFKKNLIQSVLAKLELAEGDEVYTDREPTDEEKKDEAKKELITAAAAIVRDMNSEVSTALSVKNDKYKAEDLKDGKDERDEYLQWMFGTEEGDNKADPAATGAIKVTDNAETKKDEEKTTYTFYVLVDSMKLDDDDAIWGGYLKFTGDEETRQNAAKEAKEKLFKDGKQLTGVELWHALQELGASVDYGFEKSDLSSMTALSNWLFDDSRTNSTMEIVSGKESSSSDSNKEDNKIDVTYLAVLVERTECWKATAFSGCISERRNDWLEECRKDYDLNYDLIEKITETETDAQS